MKEFLPTAVSMVPGISRKDSQHENYPLNDNQFNTNNSVEGISNTSVSTSSTNLPCTREMEPNYSPWHQQLAREQQDEQNKKPCWIWCIGGIELLSTVLYMGSFLYTTFKANSNPHVQILQIPVLLTKLFMTFTILVGLKSERASHTTFCFKFWIVCHLILFASTSVDVAEAIKLYVSSTPLQLLKINDLPPPKFLTFMTFVYRIITMILMMLFLRTDRKFECVELENVAVCEDDDESEEQM